MPKNTLSFFYIFSNSLINILKPHTRYYYYYYYFETISNNSFLFIFYSFNKYLHGNNNNDKKPRFYIIKSSKNTKINQDLYKSRKLFLIFFCNSL